MSSQQRVSLLLGAGLIGLAGAIFWVGLMPRLVPGPTPAVTSTAVPAALVNAEVIPQADWERTTALDRVMSLLAGQPAPDAEATLERLINERVVLQAAAAAGFGFQPGEAEAQARLAALQAAWPADDAAVDGALATAGLTRADLLAEIERLLRVEAYLQQQPEAAAWLAAQRASARISLLADLAPAAASASVPPPLVAPAAAPAVVPAATAASLPVGPLEGQLAPDFDLADPNGARTRLSSLRGRVVAINFWATWCPACQQELPALAEAYRQFAQRGVIVLGVDLREEAGAVTAFAGSFGLEFPLLLDADGSVSNAYRVLGIPTTVFLDSAGVVRARHIGPLTVEKFAEYVQPLLGAAGGATPLPTATAVAQRAPDFDLPRDNGGRVALADYRDKQSVVLVFYRGQT